MRRKATSPIARDACARARTGRRLPNGKSVHHSGRPPIASSTVVFAAWRIVQYAHGALRHKRGRDRAAAAAARPTQGKTTEMSEHTMSAETAQQWKPCTQRLVAPELGERGGHSWPSLRSTMPLSAQGTSAASRAA